MPPTATHIPKDRHAHTVATTRGGDTSLHALKRKLQKIVIAHTFLARGVDPHNVYKKELDATCVLFHQEASRMAHIDKQDVRVLQNILSLIESCAQSLVAQNSIKGHMYAFVRDARTLVTKDMLRALEVGDIALSAQAVLGGQTPGVVPPAYGQLVRIITTPETSVTPESALEEIDATTDYVVPVPQVGVSVRGVPTLQRSEHTARIPRPAPVATSSREDDIYAFIHKTGTVGIPAVAAAFPHVSSKTVQRALVSLIAAGKITKAGDRRWTQYTAV